MSETRVSKTLGNVGGVGSGLGNDGIVKPEAKIKLDGQQITVAPSKQHVSTSDDSLDLLNPQNRSGQAPNLADVRRYKTQDINLDLPHVGGMKKRVAGWTGGAAVLGGVGTGVGVGVGVASVTLPTAVAGVSLGSTIGGAVLGGAMLGSVAGGFGALGGALLGLGVGMYMYRKNKATERAGQHLQQAMAGMQQRGHAFTPAEKRRLEAVSADQWKSVLHVSSWKVGDKADRQAIREAVVAHVRDGGSLQSAGALKDGLIATRVSPKDVSAKNADRQVLQEAVDKMASTHGVDAAKQFKSELIDLAKRPDLKGISADKLLSLRQDSELLHRTMAAAENDARGTVTNLLNSPPDSPEFKLVEGWIGDDDVRAGGAASARDIPGLKEAARLASYAGGNDDQFEADFRAFYRNHVQDPNKRINVSHQLEQAFQNAVKPESTATVQEKQALVKQAAAKAQTMFASQSPNFRTWIRGRRDHFPNAAQLPAGQPQDLRTARTGSTPARSDATAAAKALSDTAAERQMSQSVSDFIDQHGDALLEDRFWQTHTGDGIGRPAMMVEHIAPRVALNVLDRADRNGTLTAKDLDDFNKALNPTGQQLTRDRRLPSHYAGRTMTEQLKSEMADAIKNTYGMRGGQNTDFGALPSINLDMRNQDQLDQAFADPNSTANDKIGALYQATTTDIGNFAQPLCETFKKAFDPSYSPSAPSNEMELAIEEQQPDNSAKLSQVERQLLEYGSDGDKLDELLAGMSLNRNDLDLDALDRNLKDMAPETVKSFGHLDETKMPKAIGIQAKSAVRKSLAARV